MNTTKQMIDHMTLDLAGFGTHPNTDIDEGEWVAGWQACKPRVTSQGWSFLALISTGLF